MRTWRPLYWDPRTDSAVVMPRDRMGFSVPTVRCDLCGRRYDAETSVAFYAKLCGPCAEDKPGRSPGAEFRTNNVCNPPESIYCNRVDCAVCRGTIGAKE